MTKAKEIPMGYVRCCKIIGGGNFDVGRSFIEAVALRTVHADDKHPWPRDVATPLAEAIALRDEAQEVVDAVEREEGESRVVYEAVDTATVAGKIFRTRWRRG